MRFRVGTETGEMRELPEVLVSPRKMGQPLPCSWQNADCRCTPLLRLGHAWRRGSLEPRVHQADGMLVLATYSLMAHPEASLYKNTFYCLKRHMWL